MRSDDYGVGYGGRYWRKWLLYVAASSIQAQTADDAFVGMNGVFRPSDLCAVGFSIAFTETRHDYRI